RLVAPAHPEVRASLTGVAKIGLDEMDSIGFYTQLLSLAALIMIYLLLARTFRSWLIPVFALLPLVIGIFWTLGVLYFLFGGLNIFTAMMMLVLLGLGIDFSIHLIARFREAITAGEDTETALTIMLSKTGTSVITGALTTAFAFLTLMIAETKGVFEFGAAAGLGVLITLLAIFVTLPALLAVQRQRFERYCSRRGIQTDSIVSTDTGAYNWIGALAREGWNRPALFLSIAGILAIASIWAMQHTAFEYDFMELEPKGLKSVALQREIPKRFGISDHSAWLIVNGIEESREMKEKLRKKGLVGEVASISDYIPSEAQLAQYTPQLEKFRENIKHQELPEWKPDDAQQLAAELDRLWDNLDLMSNVAFSAGLDRITRVIDELTGYNMQTNITDTTAVLPSLTRTLNRGVDETHAHDIAATWGQRMKTNLYDMANPSPVHISDLPDEIKRAHLPREGEGILLLIFPRKYLYDKMNLDRFTEQITSVSPAISGTEQLMVLMMDKTLDEGRRAALLALGVIALLLVIHFRGLSGLLALIPLSAGALAMLGLMYLIGMKYDYNNLIAVPIILGIGIDDGVHALHRFRTETSLGVQRIYDSFRFVGRAILLTSLTTMIGFGSIAMYEHRGMASFGKALFMGVGTCFIATVFVLPAILRIVYGRRKDIKT
ncbi:MMPL family transporter, partial [bacterium]|nr:MMPL family transporter [bacterium]